MLLIQSFFKTIIGASLLLKVQGSPVGIVHSQQHENQSNVPSFDDLVLWQEDMIAQGLMYRPEKRSIEIAAAEGVGFTVQNIACGATVGKKSNYERNRKYFCQFVRLYAMKSTEGVEVIIKDELCENNAHCKAIFGMTMDSIGWFVDKKININCGEIFDELWNNCHGNTGGTAQLIVSKDGLNVRGTMVNQNFPKAKTATCPANPLKKQLCDVHEF